jgi:hypothetical protein
MAALYQIDAAHSSAAAPENAKIAQRDPGFSCCSYKMSAPNKNSRKKT